MKLWRENECLYHRAYRLGIFLIGTPAEKKAIEQKDKTYFADKWAREKFAEHLRQEADKRNREKAAAEAKAERAQEAAERKLEKIRAAKERRNRLNRVAKAKQFVKAKRLRRVQRNGRTVYVNQSNDIVNYAILAYLLSGNSSHESVSPSYSYHSSDSSSYDSSPSFSSSDFGGSFGGGDSGGGGASGSW